MLMMASTIEPFSQITFDISTTGHREQIRRPRAEFTENSHDRGVELFSVTSGVMELMLSFVKAWKDIAHRASVLSAVSR